MPFCTCGDWQQWHIPCKHKFTVFNLQNGWAWDRFRPEYLNSPYLSIDSPSLNDTTCFETSIEQQNVETSPTECDLTTNPNPISSKIEAELPKHKVHLFVHDPHFIKQTYIHTYVNMYVHMYIHTHTSVHNYVRTYTYICIHRCA